MTKAHMNDGEDRILEAALAVFAEYGYEGASISAIARRAKSSKANVFHHHASKEHLYLSVLGAASRAWREGLTGAIDEAPDNFPAQLDAMVRHILKHMLREDAQSRVILREVLEHGALRGRELHEEVFAGNFEAETKIFRRARETGELRSGVDPVLAWAATTSACVFYFQTRDVLRHSADYHYADAPEHYAQGICELLLHGFATPDEENR